ncbi:MAG TPA: hypothetical protein ACFYED_11900, partial [Candidatus Tripitaka californicus]
AMIKAFQDVLELGPGELVIPQYFAVMGAIGAVLTIMGKVNGAPYRGVEALQAHMKNRSAEAATMEGLVGDNYHINIHCKPIKANGRIEA